MSSPVLPQHAPPPTIGLLDPSKYKLKEDEAEFFKAQTGIEDDEELRQHILTVQAEAYAVYPYPCIRRLSFITFKLASYPAYKAVLKIGRERPDAVFLDLGCCFGNDARKAIADGYPIQNVLLCDLQPKFYDLGHRLFKTNWDTYRINFLPGDIFDSNFLSPDDHPTSTTNQEGKPPPLDALTSLTPLQHHISVIHASSFFHLFDERQQHKLAHLLGILLSPLPGSIILGSHVSVPDQPKVNSAFTMVLSSFGHSQASWKELWVGEDGVFKPEEVALDTRENLATRDNIAEDRQGGIIEIFLMTWSITRV